MTKRDKDKKRQRPIILQCRVSEDEAALARQQARKYSVSVSALLRYGLFDQTPLRASRQPTVDKEMAGQLIGRLGQCAAALRQAAATDNPHINSALIEAVHRDMAEMRVALFQALGREP